MSNQPSISPVPSSDSPDALIHRRIKDYLDYLCAPLLGVVPYEQRLRLRHEAQDHLYSLIEDFTSEGWAAAEAVDKAVAEYGEPYRIGQEWVEAWVDRMDRDCCRIRRVSPLTWRAFGWFGVFTVATVLLIEQQLLYGHRGNLSFLTLAFCVLSPIIAGVATGINCHPRTTTYICRAFLPLLGFSLTTGCLLLPEWDLLAFALIQCLFWLPAGCLSASMTVNLRRQHNIQHYRVKTS